MDSPIIVREALSLTQPWATLVAIGARLQENALRGRSPPRLDGDSRGEGLPERLPGSHCSFGCISARCMAGYALPGDLPAARLSPSHD